MIELPWLASVFTGWENAPNARIYDFPLKPVGIVLGVILILVHLFALVRSEQTKRALLAFPRSDKAGVILLLLSGLWFFILVTRIDLGEFHPHRRVFLTAIPLLCAGSLIFLRDLLAPRALSMFLLLAAEILLDAAFLREPVTRLLLPTLAYAWILLSLVWVCVPYVLRDQITWVVQSPIRYQTAVGAGLVYGLAVLLCAIIFY
ncbi:MAG: hypothetical protein ACFCU3_10365 [Verrucomicrobiales bacterium]